MVYIAFSESPGSGPAVSSAQQGAGGGGGGCFIATLADGEMRNNPQGLRKNNLKCRICFRTIYRTHSIGGKINADHNGNGGKKKAHYPCR
jgi:hypothetical protein